MLRADSEIDPPPVTSRSQILIVDDDRMSRELLVRALQRDGFAAAECETAREALQLMEGETPALLVSDYEMPEFNGAQLCHMVRHHDNPNVAGIPIILLTAYAGEEHEVECLRAGANDFVSKPVNTAILKARIETHLRLHALRTQLQQQNTELEQWRRSHEMDLEAAQITQQAILPLQWPKISGWEVASHFQPVIQVGGDIYDWIKLPGDGWLFWIADVTGHGASAALLTALCKLVFRNAASECKSPCEVLRAVNVDFYAILRGKSFMTAACMVVDGDSGHIAFSGAGHPPLLIVRKNGEVESLASQGPPVGILANQQCGESTTELQPGDTAVLYTDGLYSMLDETGARMSPKHAAQMLPKDGRSAGDFVNLTVNQVMEAAGDTNLSDDLAVVALRRI
jgi:sigma-B regulation protein RsbU (phosphoserine phosphatase)